MNESQQPVTREDLDRPVDRLSAQFRASQGAAVVAFTTNLSELREELRRRLECLETTMTAIRQTVG